MCQFLWQLKAYPAGKVKCADNEKSHSFDLFLKLLSLPRAISSITIMRRFKCKETLSGFVTVSTYKEGDSFGWPQNNQSRQDFVERRHWLDEIKFQINIKILVVRLRKHNEILYENVLNPYKVFKQWKFEWDIHAHDNLLHEMQQSYFGKGFVSPIYGNMWCLRCYPNGKDEKGDFLLQLQLCGLPKNWNQIAVNWKVSIEAVGVCTEVAATPFDYAHSCWKWGTSILSFDEFKQCQTFSVVVEITPQSIEDVNAMKEWQKFAASQNGMSGNNAIAIGDEDDEKYPSKSMKQRLRRLEDEVVKLKDTMNKDTKIADIEKRIDLLSKDMNKNGVKTLKKKKSESEREKVVKWLKESVKLGQYSQLFLDEGFDDFESISAITKDDLIAIGIEKVGHQRKIINAAREIGKMK